jgi:YfiR/HmsC-like
MRRKPLGRADHVDPIPVTVDAYPASWTRRSIPSIPSLVVLVSLLLAGTSAIVTAQSSDDEYRVKAAFLFHFAQLVDWPADTPTGADNSLYLCTFGEDPFQGALEGTVAGKVIANRVIRIRHLLRPEDIQGCHILFLGKAQSKRIPMLLADLRKTPVLTVGETPGFLAAGGMICFLLQENKVRFEINLDAAQSAGLNIGSRLLVLAQNVVGKNQEK